MKKSLILFLVFAMVAHVSAQQIPKAKCAYCKGSGQQMCAICSGTGKTLTFISLPYPPYSATATVNCNICKGTGQSYCYYCGGKGLVDDYAEYGRQAFDKAYKAQQKNGKGSNVVLRRSYNSTNSSRSSSYTTCSQCKGSGVCTSCKGTGGEYQDVGYYTGKTVLKKIDCPSCKGSTRCFMCHGTGRI